MQNHILAIPVDWYKSWSYIVMISKEPTECGGLLFLLLEHSYLGLALLDISSPCVYIRICEFCFAQAFYCVLYTLLWFGDIIFFILI